MSNTNIAPIEQQAQQLISTIQAAIAELKQQQAQLQQDAQSLELANSKLLTVSSKIKSKIKLNIGGTLFATALETLVREKPTFFSAMFSSQFDMQPDEDGEYFIDRNPKHFSFILDYLRMPTKKIHISEFSNAQLQELKDEVDFYQIPSLIKLLNAKSSSTFLPKYCGGKIVLSDNNCKAVYKSSNSAWDAGVLALPCSKWQVTIVNKHAADGGLMIGVADPNKFNVNGQNYNSCGYYVNANAYIYSEKGDGKPLSGFASYGTESVLIVTYINGTLTIGHKGQPNIVAFTGIPSGLYPAFNLHYDSTILFEALY